MVGCTWKCNPLPIPSISLSAAFRVKRLAFIIVTWLSLRFDMLLKRKSLKICCNLKLVFVAQCHYANLNIATGSLVMQITGRFILLNFKPSFNYSLQTCPRRIPHLCNKDTRDSKQVLLYLEMNQRQTDSVHNANT